MGGFQKTTCSSAAAQFLVGIAKCSEYVLLPWTLRDDAILSTQQLLESSKYSCTSNLLLPRAKRQPATQIKKNRHVKKRTICGTFGPKFPFFLN
jgi:hypothetical protein